MPWNSRDELWEVTFRTYYDSYYHEILSGILINRWQKVDEITRVLVAVTASGSAVAGWALWQQNTFKVLWAGIAGVGAFLAITHAALGVPARLKDWGECKRHFAMLRIDFETYRSRMVLDPDFDLQLFKDDFLDLQKRYSEGVQHLPDDIMTSPRTEKKAQSNLNRRLEDQIETG
jgi:hypothetical protein